VPTFQSLRDGWQTILLKEISILDQLSKAQASVNKADQSLDSFSNRVSRAVYDHTDGNTRKQLRSALFKGKPLSRFRRPVLGGQLQAMRDWSDILSKSGVPALVALAPEALALVETGDAAALQRKKAQATNRTFRDVADRKQFVDHLNASRKEAHGALAKVALEHPNLPQTFADGFFYTESPEEQEETIDEVKASIETLKAALEARSALLKQLEEDAENEAKAEKERLAQEEAADDLEAQAQKLLEQAAAIRAKTKK